MTKPIIYTQTILAKQTFYIENNFKHVREEMFCGTCDETIEVKAFECALCISLNHICKGYVGGQWLRYCPAHYMKQHISIEGKDYD